MKALRLVLLVALAAAGARSADAKSVLDQSNDGAGGFYAAQQIGQSFTAGVTGTLFAVSVGYQPLNDDESNYPTTNISLYAGDAVDASSLIASGQSGANLSEGFRTFYFKPLGVMLKVGSNYTFSLSGHAFGGYYDAYDQYSGGAAYFDGERVASEDLSFRTYVDPGDMAADAPECATWVMMISGFGAIGCAMRRRSRNIARKVAGA